MVNTGMGLILKGKRKLGVGNGATSIGPHVSVQTGARATSIALFKYRKEQTLSEAPLADDETWASSQGTATRACHGPSLFADFSNPHLTYSVNLEPYTHKCWN
ncbi:hypothetical protein RRG08_059404 [Elysia crispata]|uniref:Uncharacterized protein n=1 Tax=Elysia crispata TaxID=231223 RepID=A0AAE0ZGI3_9GAST|nr:hypothetical protein RRG08_059404 [Elysia crispata]